MINRDEFSDALEEIRDLRAQLAGERFLHDRLRKRIEQHGEAAGIVAAKAIRDSAGVRTVEWHRASAEHAAALVILRGDS